MLTTKSNLSLEAPTMESDLERLSAIWLDLTWIQRKRLYWYVRWYMFKEQGRRKWEVVMKHAGIGLKSVKRAITRAVQG